MKRIFLIAVSFLVLTILMDINGVKVFAVETEIGNSTEDEQNLFLEFLNKYPQIESGRYRFSGKVDSDSGWCEKEGILGYAIEDFYGSNEKECLMVYISEGENGFHCLHMTMLEVWDNTCKAVFDMNLGNFDWAENAQIQICEREHEGQNFLILERYLDHDGIYKQIVIMHVDESGKIISDMILCDPGSFRTVLFAGEPKEAFIEIPVDAYDFDSDLIYRSESDTSMSEEYGEALEKKLEKYGCALLFDESSFDSDIWRIQIDDSMKLIAKIIEKKSLQGNQYYYAFNLNEEEYLDIDNDLQKSNDSFDIHTVTFSNASADNGVETGFSSREFLEAVRDVYLMAHDNHFVYGDSSTLPPCKDNQISSDRLIARALWELGMTDQEVGGETVHTLPQYLESHGFYKITDISGLAPGDIVFSANIGEVDSFSYPFVVVSCC